MTPPGGAPLLVGVDGCPAGWLAVASCGDGPIDAAVQPTALALHEATRTGPVVAIDVPVGLTDAGPRACDVAVRRLLGPRRSSVFPAPVRAALDATTYREACERSVVAQGRALSVQAFGILPRVREVDRLLRADADARTRWHEVHPELCFALWNGGAPMRHPKRDASGFAERLALVQREFGDAFAAIRAVHRRAAVADDDILDALAALWSARRIAAGAAVRVPEERVVDAGGLRMVITA